MTHDPKELFRQGKVREAIQGLTAQLRGRPSDTVSRTFLFELLCFAGDYARAERQLGVLASGSPEKESGAMVYYEALHAEAMRHQLFDNESLPSGPPGSPSGELNGRPFRELRDSDPDIGAGLEVFSAGSCVWLPFEQIDSVEMGLPRRLRDTLWAPARVCTRPGFEGMDLGEVLLPAIYPFSWRQEDQQVWLGRTTEWPVNDRGRESPAGQRMLLVDGELFPFLEVRSVRFFHSPTQVHAA